MYNIIFILIKISFSNHLFAQDKFEKESRVKRIDLPIKVISFIDSLSLDVRVRWFKEESLNAKSFEAKYKHHKVNYSVEFDSIGKIEDVEIEINWKDIKSNLRDSIGSQLREKCIDYTIIKIQRQFSGNESDLFHFLKDSFLEERLSINYELVIKCRNQGSIHLFEFLFDGSGKLISASKIIFKNSSHLEY